MWRDYFSFNKRQRNGILVLLGLIVTMIIWLNISNHLTPSTGSVDATVFKTQTNSPKQDSATHIKLSETNDDTIKANKHSINSASIKELSKLPNIGYYMAQAIVNYREQHGPYKSVKDLLKNAAVDSVTFGKIAPYLTTN
jgi:competence ComEA-like helix-hairpin-helix protein